MTENLLQIIKRDIGSGTRILTLGASRVIGNTPTFESFRFPLWTLVNNTGAVFNFVGDDIDPFDYSARPNHEDFDRNLLGINGGFSDDILQRVITFLDNNPSPDIVLFSTPGGNDAFDAGFNLATTVQNIEDTLIAFRNNNQDVKIIIEKSAGTANPALNPTLESLHTEIDNLQTTLNPTFTGTGEIIVIDIYTGFNAGTMLADALHYNQVGADYVANQYFTALSPLINSISFTLKLNNITVEYLGNTPGETGYIDNDSTTYPTLYEAVDDTLFSVLDPATDNYTDKCTTLVTNLNNAFENQHTFNQDISHFDILNVSSLNRTFSEARDFNQNISSWNTSSVVDMTRMFFNAESFNQPIGNWDVSLVTTMGNMFSSCNVFNQPLNSWNTASLTNPSRMFQFCPVFNQDLDNWDFSNVTTVRAMFFSATSFNGNISTWNVSNVGVASQMFQNAESFNSDISLWTPTSLTAADSMFRDTDIFNIDISGWNTSSFENINSMFFNAIAFNQPIGSWNTINVTNMGNCFRGATSFNQPLNNWNLSNTTNISNMFRDATSFNQDISGWNIVNIDDATDFMLGTGLSTVNYDLALVGFRNTLQAAYPGGVGYPNSGLSINFGSSQYTLGSAAETARTDLVNTFGLVITDSGGI